MEDSANRVRRHPAGIEDKPYVIRLALSNGELPHGTDVEEWWKGVYEFVWLLRVREARVGYVIVRPVYDVTMVTVSGARDDGVDAAALRSIHQGRLITWASSAKSPLARVYEQAGFHLDPARGPGLMYVRDYQR